MADQPSTNTNDSNDVESVTSAMDGPILDSTAPSGFATPIPHISAAMKKSKSFNVHVQAPLPRGFVL